MSLCDGSTTCASAAPAEKRAKPAIAAAAAGRQNSVGLRCPSHPVAHEVLKACAAKGVWGLAAPSANLFGRVSPTSALHVQSEFGDSLLILDGGECDVGIESTIVDCTRGVPVLLRPGQISRTHIEHACGVALANSYYLARLLRSDSAQDKAVVERIGVVFPNQASWGTHVNIAGGAMARHAKHPQNAVAFLNYLVSEQAQMYFADGNNEWPVVKGLSINNPALKAMGGASFKSEKLAASVVGMNQIKVQQMLDRVGLR